MNGVSGRGTHRASEDVDCVLADYSSWLTVETYQDRVSTPVRIVVYIIAALPGKGVSRLNRYTT